MLRLMGQHLTSQYMFSQEQFISIGVWGTRMRRIIQLWYELSCYRIRVGDGGALKSRATLVGWGAKRPWVAPFLEKLYVVYFSSLNSLLLSTGVNHFWKTTYVFNFFETLSVCVCICLCMIFLEIQGVYDIIPPGLSLWNESSNFYCNQVIWKSYAFFQPIKTSLFYYIIVKLFTEKQFHFWSFHFLI